MFFLFISLTLSKSSSSETIVKIPWFKAQARWIASLGSSLYFSIRLYEDQSVSSLTSRKVRFGISRRALVAFSAFSKSLCFFTIQNTSSNVRAEVAAVSSPF